MFSSCSLYVDESCGDASSETGMQINYSLIKNFVATGEIYFILKYFYLWSIKYKSYFFSFRVSVKINVNIMHNEAANKLLQSNYKFL